MKNFPINTDIKFNAILNGEDRTFKVLDYEDPHYVIKWDDGEEERAYPSDMERWTDEWKCKYIFKAID